MFSNCLIFVSDFALPAVENGWSMVVRDVELYCEPHNILGFG